MSDFPKEQPVPDTHIDTVPPSRSSQERLKDAPTLPNVDASKNDRPSWSTPTSDSNAWVRTNASNVLKPDRDESWQVNGDVWSMNDAILARLHRDDMKQSSLRNESNGRAKKGSNPDAMAPDLISDNLTSKEAHDTEREPVFSDSGYHTGKGTDTASVSSVESSGSSLGLPQDFLQNFVAVFGEILIEQSGAKAWAAYTLAHSSPEVLEKCLHDFLRDYSVGLSAQIVASGLNSLSQRAPHEQDGPIYLNDELIEGATRLIRICGPKIAAYFRFNALKTLETGRPSLSRLGDLMAQPSLFERFSLLGKAIQANGPPDDEREIALGDGDGDTDAELVYAFKVRDSLDSGDPFKNLAKAMRRSLYCDDQEKMSSIRKTVKATIRGFRTTRRCVMCFHKHFRHGIAASMRSAARKSGPFYHALFFVDWNPREFCNFQFAENKTPLREIVTLNGSALYAYPTTCAEYLRLFWPNTHDVLLPQLQIAMESGRSSIIFSDDTFLRVEFKTGVLEIHVHGPEDLLIELAQQVCWLGASLRESSSGSPTTYCEANIANRRLVGIEGPIFDISFTTRPLHSTEAPCWLSLFDNAMIAYKFPIPERENEVGLEISIDILAAIVGARHAVEYDGGLVLKGFSSILFPVKRQEERVQWHLVLGRDPDKRLTYHDALSLSQSNTRALIEEIDLNSLHSTRAIVGWCSATEILLGSEKVNYENIHYSGAKDASQRLSITGGAIGFQQFGAGQIDFKLGAKEGKFHFQRVGGPYKRIISVAEKTPVVLYDTAEKRGWLFSASAVILHIAQTRHYEDPTNDEGEPIKLFSKDTSTCSARERLLQDAGNLLSNSDGYHLKNMILDIWSLLEYLLDQTVRIDTAPGATPKATLRDTLCGFEFKAVVEERSPFRLKSRPIEKTSGGWPALVKDIDALVLFANGFEDLILPLTTATTTAGSATLSTTRSCHPLCHRYRTVPKGLDYLAATVSALIDLYDVTGCPLARNHLTSSSKLQWHVGGEVSSTNNLFGPCTMPSDFRCRCERLSQVVPDTAIGTIVGPSADLNAYAARGAATIFGQSGNLLKSLVGAGQQKSTRFYSQPNAHINAGVTVDGADDAGMDRQRQVLVSAEEEENEEEKEVNDSDSSSQDGSRNSRPSQHSSFTTPTSSYGTGDGGNDEASICVSHESVGAKKRQLKFGECYDKDHVVQDTDEIPDAHFLNPAQPVMRGRSEAPLARKPHVVEVRGQQNHKLRSRSGEENLAAIANGCQKGELDLTHGSVISAPSGMRGRI
ncbi:pfs domain protein [Diplodia corticola]|uniref:Pfs domain protein n=1 Tax=Diplodia corticola TaxID=236234 RepID=A0A1J9S261_9PEZI|nr:pfs domain protein [Diplodia corticola]OJD39051.1 pfs domain protein [Diplodia corticola]